MVLAPRVVHDRMAVPLRRGKPIGRCDPGRERIQEPLDYIGCQDAASEGCCLVVLEPQAIAWFSDLLLCEVVGRIVGEKNGVDGTRIRVAFSGQIDPPWFDLAPLATVGTYRRQARAAD